MHHLGAVSVWFYGFLKSIHHAAPTTLLLGVSDDGDGDDAFCFPILYAGFIV